ncbi:Ldh family oxidoreductase [Arenibaculum pallidiluteum]|uniref:Ldh family oxidoreductase n=1 Tax=Arenibaculum pallidiluteum TaxID=2812559 RepID=UPI001A9669F1|nr:Ldh family oxidoreductase [Arenibaculum pallidiluteum]
MTHDHAAGGNAPRHRPGDLVAFASALLARAGLDGDKAAVVAELLVDADLMGHTTHGLQLCAPYLRELETGSMARTGMPEVVSDRGGVLTLDGHRLPGVWLTAHALDLALERLPRHGLVGVAIRNSHHIGCLAAFLRRATERGAMMLLFSSDPAAASVAPFGGTRAVFTPDPVAVGIPTDGDPILVDVSASITTNGLTGRLHREGGRLPHPWLMDAQGNPTDDPGVLFADPPGTILPVGGLDHGHKGYGLALTVEAVTQGLGGFGRADAPKGWGASVYLQLMDPEAFAGTPAFVRQTGWIAEACRSNPPRPGVAAVRLPGQQGLARRREAMEHGVALHPGILESLRDWAGRFGVDMPA